MIRTSLDPEAAVAIAANNAAEGEASGDRRLAPPAVQIRGLHKRYGEVTALAGVELDIEAGSIYALLGPNGAGKSTLVRILSTLARPDAGTARIDGFDVVAQAREARRRIGVAGQFAALDGALSGRENLVLVGRLWGLSRRAAAARAGDLLDRLRLSGASERPVRTYSGGMRRRLDIVACLLVSPALLILDEPTTGVDPANRQVLWELIAEQAAAGATVLLTTQYLEEADRLASCIGVISRGRIVAEGSSAALKRRVAEDWLELSLADPEQALAAVGILRGRSPGAEVERAQARVRMAPPGRLDMHLVADVAHALAAAGLAVTEFSIQRPSLDDVVATLTGEGGAPPLQRAEEVAT